MDQNLIKLSTEQPNPNTTDIDLYSTDKVLKQYLMKMLLLLMLLEKN